MEASSVRATSDMCSELHKFLKADCLDKALNTAVHMESNGMPLTRDTAYQLLQVCTKKKDLTAARQIHTLIQKSQLRLVTSLANNLIRLFALCGSLPEAGTVFRDVKKPTLLTWNAIISAHAKFGEGMHALQLYRNMLQSGQEPDKITFLSILKACSNAGALIVGRSIHEQIIMSDVNLDLALGNTLVDMYAKCGSLEEAENIFRRVPDRNVVSWDVIIGGYAQHGNGTLALQLFHEMQHEGIQPDRVTFLGVLRACCCVGTSKDGALIHDQIIRTGLESDVAVASTLVDMYAKCGGLQEARLVFDSMACPTLVSWGCLISGYTQYGQGVQALEVFESMEMRGLGSDKYIYSGVLKACGLIQDLVNGRLIHERVVRARLESGEVVGNTLVDMYVKCGSLKEAQKVFDSLVIRNAAAWGSIMTGHTEFGSSFSALKIFGRMQCLGIEPSKVTYLCVVKACCGIHIKQAGRLAYHGIVESSFEEDILMGSALVDMFSKYGEIIDARHIFDRLQEHNVVTWGAILTGYAQQELALPTLELYELLLLENVEPNRVIFYSALKACCTIGTWGPGAIIHAHIIKSTLEMDSTLGNALVDMYARCGSLQEAQNVFNKLSNPDVISYSALITGYSECGDCKMALNCLTCMCSQGLIPDVIIFTNALAACNRAGLIDEGYELFNQMRTDYGIVPDMGHFTCIIDLLGSGGRLREAEAVIDTMHISPDLAIWRSLLTNSYLYKDIELGSRCFENAIRLDPDDATAYNLMANIYMDANRWDKVHEIQEQHICVSVQKKSNKAWIGRSNANAFTMGTEGPMTDFESSISKRKLISRPIEGCTFISQSEPAVGQELLKKGNVSAPHHLFEQKLVNKQKFKSKESLKYGLRINSMLRNRGLCSLSAVTSSDHLRVVIVNV
ncbi:hypothetical protein KP509_13G082600 [Ceratopteris richardii]|uniref:Pentatricopeptide repeat-containing protein n=1 Tax=Ceratopteris richardii TaxID=49495 RepID=A0A8T2TH62_CERRI|nr:hypothetical protein KP509_13G082600 [Ceratopteris richardii]KAH7421942.1 hypothetical protein KP509_13G082600 [Ceratopteris richardii]